MRHFTYWGMLTSFVQTRFYLFCSFNVKLLYTTVGVKVPHVTSVVPVQPSLFNAHCLVNLQRLQGTFLWLNQFLHWSSSPLAPK